MGFSSPSSFIRDEKMEASNSSRQSLTHRGSLVRSNVGLTRHTSLNQLMATGV